MEARGDALRALVLCDAELAEAKPDPLLGGVLDPAAGTARHALMALGADSRTAPLRPLIVSGRGLRCLPGDAEVLLAALVEQAAEHLALPEWEAAPDGVLMSLRSSGAEWVPRAWVELATRVLESGVCGALIGTRALLGEGWDCPMVNCLVDLTVASTGVSVQQMRGRSLRLDPGDPSKLASNWDVVCVAPELVRGQRRLRALRAQAPAPLRAGRRRRDRGRPLARAPGAQPVRAPARHPAQRAQPRDAGPRRGDRGGTRALADRRALPRRRPPNPRRPPTRKGV